MERSGEPGAAFTIRLPMQLAGNRKFEVNLTGERIDLSKARRVEPRATMPHLPLGTPRTGSSVPPGPGAAASIPGPNPGGR
jgi:hypothetical protein